MSLRLHLGCGNRKLEGFVNIDIEPFYNPDMVCNLEEFPWPFEDSSVDEITAEHVLEHIGKDPQVFLKIIKELYRVCKHAAMIHIALPHPRSDFFLMDPTHVRPILPETLAMFNKKKCIIWQRENFSNTPLALYCNVDFEIVDFRYTLHDRILNAFQKGEITQEDISRLALAENNVLNDIKIEWRCLKNNFSSRKVYAHSDNKVLTAVADMDPFIMNIHPHGEDLLLSPEIRDFGTWEVFGTAVFKKLCLEVSSVLDIGANIGWYSIIAGLNMGKKARIVAYEPNPKNAELLRKNIKDNKLSFIQVEESGLGDTCSQMPLYLAKENKGDHRFSPAKEDREHITVPITTLDNKGEMFDLVKVDAQGFEMKILRGAKKLFENNWRPIFLLEFSPKLIAQSGDDPHELLNFFAEKKYTFIRLNHHTTPPNLTQITVSALKEAITFIKEQKNEEVYIDLLLLPEGRKFP